MSKTNHKTNTQRSVPIQVPTGGPCAHGTLHYEHESKEASMSNGHPTDVNEETIRMLAHSKWQAAGCPLGDGIDFWLQAEQELQGQRSE